MANAIQQVTDKIKKAVGKKTDPQSGVNQMLNRWWNDSEMARRELDWKWFQYDLWYNGNHYARWDKNTQQIVSSTPRTDGRPKVTINKVYSTLRSVRSHVLQNDPIAEVTPFNMTDQDVDQAMYLNRFMFYLHDHLHLRSQLRATMLHALKYSIGWWQVMWDENAEDGQGGIVVNVVDPYDLYVDPVARLPKEARFMILAVRRNIDDLRNDPKYKDADWDSVVGSDNLAASTLKSRILSYERGQYSFNDGQKDHGSVILKEFWYKESYDSEEEQDDPDNEGKTIKVKTKKDRIMICAKVGEEIVRQPEDTKLDRLPFFRLASDVEPLSMYGQGWIKNLVPLNKLLELNESSAAEYNVIVNKGRYSAPKNAGIKTVTNQHGIFVEHKMGAQFAPQAMEIPQLSQELGNQIERINQYIEDIGCQHDASRGEGSPDATSGVAIEALQEGDSTNLSELLENTEEFLEDVYEYILSILAQKTVTARNVITSTVTGEKMFFKVIGEEADDDLKQQGQQPDAQNFNGQPQQTGDVQPNRTIILPKKCAVDVQITSYMAYTSQGRRAAMKDLASFPQMQNLPPDVILKAYNVGPIADIVKQMRDEEQHQAEIQQQQEIQQNQAQGQQQMQQSAQQHQQQLEQQQQQAQIQQAQQAQQQQAEAQAQQAKQPKDQGAMQAIAFIKEVINAVDNGAPLPQIPKKITPQFIQYLTMFINSPEGQQNPDISSALEMVKNHAVLGMQGGGVAAQ